MKRKYHGVIVAGMAMAVIVVVSGYAGSGLWQKTEAVSRIPHPAVIDVKAPSETQVRQMDRLYERMHALAAPSKRNVAARKLSLFGYQGPGNADADLGGNDGSLEQAGFQLTLVVLAGFGSYCIVDGNFMAEGAQMDDGTKVLKIESHRVLIARRHERKWIYLENQSTPSYTPPPHENSGRQRGQS